jgi:hypothetical protein
MHAMIGEAISVKIKVQVTARSGDHVKFDNQSQHQNLLHSTTAYCNTFFLQKKGTKIQEHTEQQVMITGKR